MKVLHRGVGRRTRRPSAPGRRKASAPGSERKAALPARSRFAPCRRGDNYVTGFALGLLCAHRCEKLVAGHFSTSECNVEHSAHALPLPPT